MRQFVDDTPCLNTFKITSGETEAKVISGTISWDKGFGTYLTVQWTADLRPPTGKLQISYVFSRTETQKENIVTSFSLKSRSAYNTKNSKGINKWAMLCPLREHKNCKKWVYKSYLSRDGYFGCHNCAKVFSRNSLRDHSLDGLCKKPGKMAQMLSSKFIPIKKKLAILEIANRFLKKRKKMLNSYRRKVTKLRKLGVILPESQIYQPRLSKRSRQWMRSLRKYSSQTSHQTQSAGQ